MFASFDSSGSSCHYSTDHYTMFRNDSIQDLSAIFMTSSFTDHHQDCFLQQQEEQEELLLAQLAQQQLLTDTAATVSASASDHNNPCNNTVPNAHNKDDSLNGNKDATGTAASKKRSTKRSGKKDRHSKIATAQGVRDRRMRLSLEVAHRFFTLQDTLGFDKASKTVEWLLSKSKSAIRELGKGLSQRKHNCIGVNSTAEYDQVVSEIEKGQLGFCPQGKYSFEDRKKSTMNNKPTFNHVLAKESRAKARERARERTIEKMRSRELDKIKQKSSQEMNFQTLKSLSPFQERGSRTNIDMKSSIDNAAMADSDEEPIFHSDLHQGPDIENIVDKSFVITGNSNSSMADFKNHHDLAMSNFTHTWSHHVGKTAGNIRENTLDSIFFSPADRDVRLQSPFDADVQLFGKPWDLYDNHINPKID